MSEWMQANATWVAIGVSILVLAYFVIEIVKDINRRLTKRQRPSVSPLPYVLIILGYLFFICIIFSTGEIERAAWAQILLMIGLVTITAVYAWSTGKMAKEMKEQRVTASRPFIIQRAEQKKAVEKTITKGYFSHFEIYNTGNGPAIELEISLLNEEKSWTYSARQSYLRTGESVKLLPEEFGEEQSLLDIETTVKLFPIHLIAREKQAYLVSEYQNIFSDRQNPTWYQTWLPFKVSKAGKKGEIYVIPGELEFHEVPEKDRIDAFSSKSKPK